MVLGSANPVLTSAALVGFQTPLFLVWWLMGLRGLPSSFFLFFFFWSVGYGLCDQRQARMLVTGLGGVAGFSISLEVKNLCGAWGYIRIAGAGLGLFKISWGKNLKGTVIFGWLALLTVLLSSGCLQLCCMDQKSTLIPKLTKDYHTISMEQINNKINPRSQHLRAAWSQHQAKIGVGTSVRETHVFNNSQNLSYNNQKKCLNS